MPGLDELQWREYVDFTGGLWERGNDRECAPNGLLESTDCFPLPSGGLKAFAEFGSFGLPIRAGDEPGTPASAVGIWHCEVGNAGGYFTFLVEGAGAGTAYTVRGYFLGSAFPDPLINTTEWKPFYTKTNVNVMSPGVRFVPYNPGTAGAYFNLPVALLAGTTNGVYAASVSTVAAAFAFVIPNSGSAEPYGLWSYQDRLVMLGRGLVTNAPYDTIWYTNPGSTAMSTANYLQISGGGKPTEFLEPFAPSDLMYLSLNGSFGTVQGAITAPTVRDYDTTHSNARGFPIRTPIGLVMVIRGVGAFAYDGQSLQSISTQIIGDRMGGDPPIPFPPAINVNQDVDYEDPQGWPFRDNTGHLGCFAHWVFFNQGYMMDSRTGAWFKQTSVPRARYWWADQVNQRMLCASGASIRKVENGRLTTDPWYYSPMGESEWIPMHTYSFTLPLILNIGQKTNVRQLEYHLSAFNDASTLEVELTFLDGNSQQQTLTLGPYDIPSASPHQIRVNVGGHPSDWWKVRTILKSNRSGVAAPTLERMFCGTDPATRYPAA